MTKKIQMSPRPSSTPPAPTPDAWVESREALATSEPIKRLTVDLPASLHRRIKSDCASRGTKMAEELRELIAQKYGKA